MGVHEDKLTSFEYALRNAGIAGTNLVLISSIFPPGAKLISRTAGLKLIKPGTDTFHHICPVQSSHVRHILDTSKICLVKWNTSEDASHLLGDAYSERWLICDGVAHGFLNIL